MFDVELKKQENFARFFASVAVFASLTSDYLFWVGWLRCILKFFRGNLSWVFSKIM
jgi:hypothetical protein